MEIRAYILELFEFNNIANKKQIQVIKSVPDLTECVSLFSTLINSYYKWMTRITNVNSAGLMDWWDPIYPLDQLEFEWTKCQVLFINYFKALTEEALDQEILFTAPNNTKWVVTPLDIAVQLNFNCIHQRAEIQTLIKQQGIEIEPIDFILTRYRIVE